MTTRDRFIGTWRLESYTTTTGDGAVRHRFGEDAVGLLVYTREGYMSGQIMKRNHESAAEYIAYCGPFRVDEASSEVVHIVEASLNPRWVGGEQSRKFSFSGDRMTLSAVVQRSQTVTHTLVWIKIS